MVTATHLEIFDRDLAPRRPATVEAIDARLSVWGQASRLAITRRAESLAEAAELFAARHGRDAARLATGPVDGVAAMLGLEAEEIGLLAAGLLPSTVRASCRILWVDPARLSENLLSALAPHLDGARGEIRRLQALHRRRARLWKDDPERLDKLRNDVESLTVPRSGPRVIAAMVEELEKHRARALARA